MDSATSHPPLSPLGSGEIWNALQAEADGRVIRVVGLLIEGYCPRASIGDLVRIGDDTANSSSTGSVLAEVIGIRDGRILMVSLGELRGIANGTRLRRVGSAASVACCESMLGRVIDAKGNPLDLDKGPLGGPFESRPLYQDSPDPMAREVIEKPLFVGLRVIDGLLTLGRGQRIGIMAGAGVGKTTLLSSLALHAHSDVNVIALIGERGREVQEFLHQTLSDEARARTVVVAVTSDRSPLERTRGAYLATAIAEYFSSKGKDVLLMMDSLTRFAMAQRELGLSAGEPPTTRGYTPSVFSNLPRLLERAGNFRERGSITGIYTVLVEGDDLNDPVGDAARSILDGHIVLSRNLASRGHYPAVDALQSLSRVASSVTSPAQQQAARGMRFLLANLNEVDELRQIGAYVPGADLALDRAVQKKQEVMQFLQQEGSQPCAPGETVKRMTMLSEGEG